MLVYARRKSMSSENLATNVPVPSCNSICCKTKLKAYHASCVAVTIWKEARHFDPTLMSLSKTSHAKERIVCACKHSIDTMTDGLVSDSVGDMQSQQA